MCVDDNLELEVLGIDRGHDRLDPRLCGELLVERAEGDGTHLYIPSLHSIISSYSLRNISSPGLNPSSARRGIRLNKNIGFRSSQSHRTTERRQEEQSPKEETMESVMEKE